MPKVSIVVPVFKVEEYIERCMNSIQEQTLSDIEIILVDDGSPDHCPEICDRYAQMDSRVRVVHKTNGGLSSARNAGLKVATGKYIGFVDSDDTVSPQMYQTLYDIITREKVNFVMADYMRVLDGGKSYLKTLSIDGGRYDKDKIREAIFPQLIMGENVDYGPLLSVWHCLYDLNFLRENNLLFDDDVRWSEDNIFSAKLGYLCDSFYYIKGNGLYNYYQNPGTITTSYRNGAWQVYRTMNQHLHDFFDGKTDFDFSKQLKLHMIYYACNSLGQVPLSKEKLRKQIHMIKEIMNDVALVEAFRCFQFPDSWNFKFRVVIWLIKYRCAALYRILVLR